MLETIIQWVNANKQPLAGVMQPNVVLGQSMGGVIARYALKDMENNSINHQTRLYISHDAPHQGANVPEGYQHLARHARGLYIRAGISTIWVEIVQLIRGRMSPIGGLSLADQPASRQMLINFVDEYNNIDNSVHNAWQTELKNLGYPNGVTGIPFRKVAISNGSECANSQAFAAGDRLLTYNGKANTNILGDLLGIGFLPVGGILLGQPLLLAGGIPGRNDFNFDFYVNAQADGISNHIYHGKITYTKKIFWLIPVTTTLTNRNYQSNATTLPYDNFPGGYYDLDNDGNINLKSSENQIIFAKYGITASNQQTFNFVPTVSALDIGSNNVTLTKADYLTKYIGATPPASPKNSPFDNFITAFNNDRINEHHISIERRNGDWIAAELNGSQPAADCSAICQDFQIYGNGLICTSESYSISSLPANTTIVWTVSPTGIVNIVPPNNTQTVTLNRTGNGTCTLTATISNPCNPGSISITRSITTETANISGTYNSPTSNTQPLMNYYTPPRHPITEFNSACAAFVTNLSLPYNTPVTWSGSVDLGVYWYQSGKDIFCNFTAVGQTAYFSVSVTSSCGTSYESYNFKCTTMASCGVTPLLVGGGEVMLAPNPASSNLTISLKDKTESAQKINTESAQRTIKEIRIVDKMGNVKQTFKYAGGIKNTSLNVSLLKTDVYAIQVFDGQSWYSEKFIKN